MDRCLIVSNVSDDPFAIDIGYLCGQRADVADLISLKSFLNSEFCPRFIGDEQDSFHIGHRLDGKTVIIVSTFSRLRTRNDMAMRTMLVAKAARDNGAEHVVLVEPDLFYSAQDRGPRPDQGLPGVERGIEDRRKFDGQPWSIELYANLLHTAGIDSIVTVHNHSEAVEAKFSEVFEGRFFNLSPASLYAHYISDSDLVNRNGGFVLCAPDGGAEAFVQKVQKAMNEFHPPMITLRKVRTGERSVQIGADPDSEHPLEVVHGKDVVVIDDMVRTGNTILEACRLLKQKRAHRVVFLVTHFHSSVEVRENLNFPCINEIVTTNSIPGILNRDLQGRLRKKLLVLKIEKWLSRFLLKRLDLPHKPMDPPYYRVDISSKNPRWETHQKKRKG